VWLVVNWPSELKTWLFEPDEPDFLVVTARIAGGWNGETIMKQAVWKDDVVTFCYVASQLGPLV